MKVEAHLNDAKDVLVTVNDSATFGLPKDADMEMWLFSRIRAEFGSCDEEAVSDAVASAKKVSKSEPKAKPKK